MQHPNAPLTPIGRRRMVLLVEQHGYTFEAAAAASNVVKSTVHRWVWRWRSASPAERQSLSCLEDRSSRPRTSPAMLPAQEQAAICAVRERTGWGPRLIASEVGRPHSTIHATLRRHGRSRRPAAPREPIVRYEWPCPGDLLHMDTKRYARFSTPGHALTGDRHRTGAEKRARVGYDFAHAVVDDHSRLAYCELHDDERAATVAAFTRRALAWFEAHGIAPRRLLTDNAFVYRKNLALAALLAEHQVKHLLTRPRRPQTNGKVERFHQTMEREWAKSMTYASHNHRNQALPHWLEHYNERRRHSAIGDHPPISRVRNLSGQDS